MTLARWATRLKTVLLAAALAGSLAGCGYNDFQRLDVNKLIGEPIQQFRMRRSHAQLKKTASSRHKVTSKMMKPDTVDHQGNSVIPAKWPLRKAKA